LPNRKDAGSLVLWVNSAKRRLTTWLQAGGAEYAAPTELGISFRGGFYKYNAPLALEWVPNAVGTHKNLTNSSSGFYGRGAGFAGMVQDNAGGPQDFPGASRNFAGTT